MRFSKFDSVVEWYDRTKPVISKHHTAAHDVRPIGDRRRKWERIKKVDDNTYALCDGLYGNVIWNNGYKNMSEFETLMAPIVWTREADGDYVRIRNNSASCSSVSRYNFLRWNLPMGMGFAYNRQGQHWVNARVRGSGAARLDWEKFVLPKTNSKYDYGTQTIEASDDVYLKFRVNDDGTFTRVSRELTVTTRRVDKDLKREYAPALEEFYTFMCAMAPMLRGGWSIKAEYQRQLREFATPGVSYWQSIKACPPEPIREIVSNPDHALRPALVAVVADHVGFHRATEPKEVRAAYVRFMNTLMGFYKTEEK